MSPEEVLSIPSDYDRVACALLDEILGSGTDAETAEVCEVSAEYVRAVRKDLERSGAVLSMLRDAWQAVRHLGYEHRPGYETLTELVRDALREYVKARAVPPRDGQSTCARTSRHPKGRAPHTQTQSRAQSTDHGSARAAASSRAGTPGVGSQGADGRKASGGMARG